MGAPRLIVLAVAAAALGGCSGEVRGSAPGGDVAHPLPPAATGPAATRSAGAGPAEQVARAFAVAARDWSADTLAARWRRQIALSTGTLRLTLLATPPRRADIDRLRAEDAAAHATVERVVVEHATARTVRLVVRLRERIVARGTAGDQVTDNLVTVARRGKQWRVTAFDLAP
jgi:hypothetical protein